VRFAASVVCNPAVPGPAHGESYGREKPAFSFGFSVHLTTSPPRVGSKRSWARQLEIFYHPDGCPLSTRAGPKGGNSIEVDDRRFRRWSGFNNCNLPDRMREIRSRASPFNLPAVSPNTDCPPGWDLLCRALSELRAPGRLASSSSSSNFAQSARCWLRCLRNPGY